MVLVSSPLWAQKVLSEQEFVAIVKKFHPVAKQVYLDVQIAKANITASRGAFDPTVRWEKSQKEWDGITYYDEQRAEIKIPTWYGIDLYAGKEIVEGSRINPEETKGSLNYVGASISLVQNLVIDKRRAALQQARILADQADVTRRAMLNDLLLESLTAYWQWWEQHQLLTLVQASLRNAQKRFEMVKTTYNLGDRPAIDTLEALTQVQQFQQRQNEIELALIKSSLELSAFLWTGDTKAYDLPRDVVPQEPREEQIQLDTLLMAANIHPELLVYDFKQRSLQIEKRLKFQALLPDVDLKYNQLGRDVSNTIKGAWLQNNYRYGISVAVPLRLSEGRGGYQAAKLKIEQTRLAELNKRVQVQNKVKQYYVEWQQTSIQKGRQAELVKNYLTLQRGEELRFANGESSLFLINARELKTIEGQQKLVELEGKRQRARQSLKWAAGLFGND
jgi:outer membrane protein TolC